MLKPVHMVTAIFEDRDPQTQKAWIDHFSLAMLYVCREGGGDSIALLQLVLGVFS